MANFFLSLSHAHAHTHTPHLTSICTLLHNHRISYYQYPTRITALVQRTLSPSHSTRQSKSSYGNLDSEPVSILHPDVARAESLIRSAWADARLVAD